MMQLDTMTHNASRQMADKLEHYLRMQVAMLGITVEEFARDYILEEHPLEWSFGDGFMATDFKIRQEFRVRLKTAEERAGLPVTGKEEQADG